MYFCSISHWELRVGCTKLNSFGTFPAVNYIKLVANMFNLKNINSIMRIYTLLLRFNAPCPILSNSILDKLQLRCELAVKDREIMVRGVNARVHVRRDP